MVDVPRTARVVATGLYFPVYVRSARGGSLPVANGDEDAVTMAIEAGLDCLDRFPEAVTDPPALYIALGGAALTDGPQIEVLREALGLGAETGTATFAGSAMAGISALRAAFDAVDCKRHQSVLVIASEAGDRVGNGAVSLLVSAHEEVDGLAILELSEHGEVLYDRWRAADESTSHIGDQRYISHRYAAALTELVDGRDGVVVAGMVPDADTVTALRLDVPALGVAEPLLVALAAYGEAPSQQTVVAVASSGRVVLFAVHGPAEVPEYFASIQRPEPCGRAPELPTSPALSLPPGSPFFARSAGEFLRLEAALCSHCGLTAFPPSQRPICSGCGHTDWVRYPMSRSATVYTYTANRFLPTGFGSEMILILGELADGNRYWAPASGLPSDDVAIGSPMRLTVRRFTQQDGVPAYAMKFVPQKAAVPSVAVTA